MAQFYQVAGTQLALPDYARVDLAYTQHDQFGTLPAGTIKTVTAPGNFLVIPLSVFGQLVTSNAVANRVPTVELEDELGNAFQIAVAAQAQTASATAAYSFNVGQPSAYGPVGGFAVVGLPAVALLPGWNVTLTAFNIAAGDVWSQVDFSYVRIPTGPPVNSATPVLTPTPLIA